MSYLLPDSDAPPPTHTVVLVMVPEADPLVGEHRQHLDAAAGWGVPAHVTVLYPFVDPRTVGDALLADLRAAAGSVSAFDCRFLRTCWFGQDMLWLDPDPGESFRELTAAVSEAFPQHPPYAGAHPEVVPHLTVAERRLGDLAALQAADRAVRAGLPLATRVEHAVLVAGAHAPRSWRILAELPLGKTGPATS